MSDSSGAYGVDLAGLAEAADGIRAVLDEMGKHAMHGVEDSGEAIKELGLTGDTAGNADLANGLAEMCGRAHYAARNILSKAEDMVGKLQDTRTTYQKAEDTVVGLFHRIGHDLTGNPMSQGGRA